MKTELENKPKHRFSRKKYIAVFVAVLIILILAHARLFFKTSPYKLTPETECEVYLNVSLQNGSPSTISGTLKEIHQDDIVIETMRFIEVDRSQYFFDRYWIPRKNILYIKTTKFDKNQ